jgi:hypothetical protein
MPSLPCSISRARIQQILQQAMVLNSVPKGNKKVLDEGAKQKRTTNNDELTQRFGLSDDYTAGEI